MITTRLTASRVGASVLWAIRRTAGTRLTIRDRDFDLRFGSPSDREALLRGDDRTRLIPIVVLTSSAEEQDLLRSYGLGANSYVRKPVDFNQFVDAVRQLGLYWLVINHAAPPAPAGSAVG